MLTALVLLSLASDSPRFRGPDGNGVFPPGLPAAWSDRDVTWKAEVPGGGWSAPVIVAGRVFVTTAASGGDDRPKNFVEGVKDLRSMVPLLAKKPDKSYRFELHCLDAATGKPLWKRTVIEKTPPHACHPSNTFATETPASDGEHVYALFHSAGVLAAFDLEGKKLWQQETGAYKMTAGFGTGSSLAAGMGLVFVQNDNEEKSFVAAFEGKTGKEVWRKERKGKSAWSTPLLWKNRVRAELVTCGGSRVVSYDPRTGEELWSLGKVASFTSSPAADGERVYFGYSNPTTTGPLYAVKAGAKGDITPDGDDQSSGLAWLRRSSGPGMPSPVAAGGLVYVMGSVGLTAYDAATGEVKYRQRLPKARTVAASLWAAGDRVFVLDEAGTTFAIKAGPRFELAGTNKLDDTFWATPAAAGGALYLRGTKALYCVRKP